MNTFRGYWKSLPSGERFLHVLFLCIAVALIFLLPGQSHAQSGNVYGNGQVQINGPTEEAVVLQVMIKKSEPGWQSRTAGATIGGALGALVASNTTSGNARYAANLIGMTLGGIVGERTANAVMSDEAQELILQVHGRNGPPRIITVIQPAPYDRLVAGEAVYLINTGGKFRVVKQLPQTLASGQ